MSRKKRNNEVRQAFRREDLSRVCMMPEAEFAGAYGMETVNAARGPHGEASSRPDDFYCFKDNGASVLAVAHLDTVVGPNERAARYFKTQSGPVVVSGALDDRLGAYITLELLPSLGITYDVLLTTGEESGQSTAEFFTPQKDYDWIIEFDRGGTDVVMYQYEDDGTRQAVEASGAVTGAGSFTDICYLEHLGVKGFNWGVGYRDYHSTRSHAYLNETFSMVEKYRRFHALNAGTAMPHAQEKDDDYWYGSYRKDDPYCNYCAGTVDLETGYCDDCTRCTDCSQEQEACFCWLPSRLGSGKDYEPGDLYSYAYQEDAGVYGLALP